MIEMESTPELPTPGSIKIGDLNITSEQEIPEGAHVLLTEAEVPHKPGTIFLSTGHTVYLPPEMIEPSDLYFIKRTSKVTNETYYDAYGNINPTNLVNNKMFQENPMITTPNTLLGEFGEMVSAQDLAFNVIHQEFMQGNTEQRLVMLEDGLESKREHVDNEQMTQRINNNIDTIINLINTRFETEYNQAAAVNKLIELTKTDSEWKSIVKEEVDKILRPDNSDEVVPMEELRNQIQEKVQKLMATY
jgi:hypothetical protein